MFFILSFMAISSLSPISSDIWCLIFMSELLRFMLVSQSDLLLKFELLFGYEVGLGSLISNTSWFRSFIFSSSPIGTCPSFHSFRKDMNGPLLVIFDSLSLLFISDGDAYKFKLSHYCLKFIQIV